MKETVKEKTTVTKYTVYQAVDGTEFDNEEECLKYENSALGVLRGKLKKLIVNEEYNGWELMGGEGDSTIIAVKVEKQEDIDVVLQTYYLDQPWILKENEKRFKEKAITLVHQAFEEKDLILFGLNCDNNLYIIDTRMNIVNRLNNLDKKSKE